jgi:ubiquinol-cytochrome c reductase cytochrome c subunit
MPLESPDEPSRRRKPAYSEETIAALVDHVATFGGGGPEIPKPVLEGADLGLGGELFRQQCAACHSWSGTGGALLDREAPTLYQSTPVQTAEAILVGPGTMPAFGPAALDDEQVDNLVAYVEESIRHPRDRGGSPIWHLGPLAEGGVAFVLGLGGIMLIIRWIGERE